ncbi:fam-b protein [Plasmodium vinckei brucechwatti]|uniref:Fam-b protein n=1 Tax=Plasmodium vinckei brucechwatti TaxID=119398 RepID=A0A6V7SSP0_PLAVN|nr:fam-b protein [Plasmodium vinckei brucechwatti]
MRISILKYVFFSIIIGSFDYAKNESYYVNERNIYLERNIINFRNNRVLADADNEFDLYDFYQSSLNLAKPLNDCNDNDKGNIYLRNIRDPHVKKHKESIALPNLNNEYEDANLLIQEMRKELEETKKELDKIKNGKLAIQPIQDKIIIKEYENNSVQEHPDFKQMENYGHIMETEDRCNENASSSNYNGFEINQNLNQTNNMPLKRGETRAGDDLMTMASDACQVIKLIIPYMVSLAKKSWRDFKFKLNFINMPKILR